MFLKYFLIFLFVFLLLLLYLLFLIFYNFNNKNLLMLVAYGFLFLLIFFFFVTGNLDVFYMFINASLLKSRLDYAILVSNILFWFSIIFLHPLCLYFSSSSTSNDLQISFIKSFLLLLVLDTLMVYGIYLHWLIVGKPSLF